MKKLILIFAISFLISIGFCNLGVEVPEDVFEDYLRWMSEWQEVFGSKVTLTMLEENDRPVMRVVATEDIKQGDRLFGLRHEELSISSESLRNTPLHEIKGIIDFIRPLEGEVVKIMLVCMVSKLLGNQDFHPFVETFRTDFSTHPFYFDAEELEIIRHTDLFEKVLKLRADIEQSWELFYAHFHFKKLGKLDPKKFDKDLFVWAALNTLSLKQQIKKNLYIMPIYNSIRCCGETEKMAKFEMEILNRNRTNALFAQKDFKKGEEIVFNLEKPNWEYALYKGFVHPNNANDCIEVELEYLDEHEKDYYRKAAVIMERAMSELEEVTKQTVCIGRRGLADTKTLKHIGYSRQSIRELLSHKPVDHHLISMFLITKMEDLDHKFETSLEQDEKAAAESVGTAAGLAWAYRVEFRKNIAFVLEELEKGTLEEKVKMDL